MVTLASEPVDSARAVKGRRFSAFVEISCQRKMYTIFDRGECQLVLKLDESSKIRCRRRSEDLEEV